MKQQQDSFRAPPSEPSPNVGQSAANPARRALLWAHDQETLSAGLGLDNADTPMDLTVLSRLAYALYEDQGRGFSAEVLRLADQLDRDNAEPHVLPSLVVLVGDCFRATTSPVEYQRVSTLIANALTALSQELSSRINGDEIRLPLSIGDNG